MTGPGRLTVPRRRLLRVVLLACALGLLGAAPAAALPAATTGFEQIQAYDVRLVLGRDGTLSVQERIEYDFGPSADRHGIYRTIPVIFAYDDAQERVYEIDDVQVSSPSGAPADVDEQRDGGYLSLRIGDPDETVEGRQTYVIGYRVRGALNSFDDRQELYWNAIGTEWSVTIVAATASVEGPAPIDRITCFQGAQGSTATCRSALRDGAATFSAADLQPAQGLTVVAAFPAGTFTGGGPILRDRQTLARAFSLDPVAVGGAAAVLALVGGGAAALVSRRGRDERYLGVTPGLEPGVADRATTARVPWLNREPVAVQFHPPQGMRPGQLGTLLDERANVVDVTATIIDLAVRGHLRIEEVQQEGWFRSGDWRLVQTRPPEDPRAEPLHDYEETLLNAIFASRSEVLLSEIKQTFRSDLQRVQGQLYDDVTRRGWFRGNPSSVRIRWQVLGVLLAALGVGATFLLTVVLRSRFGLVGLALLVAGLVVLVLAPRMPARTARGTAMLAQARGFREYLETAEANQIRFEEGEDVFSRYLPFAIVFGVAERWARVFAQLAASGAAVAVPTWYVGSGFGPGYFDYGGFGNSVNSFADQTSGSIAAATPSSSGSSGFGGGGFSGGGGGGGGGGSW